MKNIQGKDRNQLEVFSLDMAVDTNSGQTEPLIPE
jgi:hypothetical protein